MTALPSAFQLIRKTPTTNYEAKGRRKEGKERLQGPKASFMEMGPE